MTQLAEINIPLKYDPLVTSLTRSNYGSSDWKSTHGRVLAVCYTMAMASRTISPSRMGKRLAARSKRLGQKELEAAKPREDLVVSPDLSINREVEAKFDPLAPFQIPLERSEVQLTAARLYGQGFRRPQIARALLHHLVPADTKCRTDEQKLAQARKKLRNWEHTQDFRDLVYKHAVVDLDMSTPQILSGLAKSAKRGRVDAARLVLELTGRHTKDDATTPTQVTVNLLNVARPE